MRTTDRGARDRVTPRTIHRDAPGHVLDRHYEDVADYEATSHAERGTPLHRRLKTAVLTGVGDARGALRPNERRPRGGPREPRHPTGEVAVAYMAGRRAVIDVHGTTETARD